MTRVAGQRVRVRALAKINLSLRVLGLRADGYHELRTEFQSIALHDTLTCEPVRGPFAIACSDPACPTDESNLVWRAADLVWRHARRGRTLGGMRVEIRKRIPMQAGLGGGSSDAAAALRALALAWRIDVNTRALAAMARELGADVPYFLEGGTALGVERGDRLFALLDAPPSHVVVVVPPFGVGTRDAFAWWDRARRRHQTTPETEDDLRNDLEAPVIARHPEIARLIGRLRRLGARSAAMSGSGSAVFGLFDKATVAHQAADSLGRAPYSVFLTQTVNRRRYERLASPHRLSPRA